MPKQEFVTLRISGMTCEECAVKTVPSVSREDSSQNGQYDLVILGGGSGAFAAAIKASEMGVKVAMVEEGVMGGTCLNRGCVPTKHLIRAAEIYYLAGHNPFPGITTKQGKVNLTRLIEKKDELIQWAQKAKYWDVLEHHKNVTFIQSRGIFVVPDRLRVNGGELSAPKYIIATGASPFIPPIEGLEKVRYLTSTEALELKRFPKSIIVLGANAVGLEFAQMFQRLGTQVTIHEIAGRIAPGEEPEISQALENYLKEEGVEICTCSKVIEAREERGKKVIVSQMPNGGTKEFWADELLIATGRRPNTQGIGLEAIGVATGPRGGIKVNEQMQTSVPHIYAVGDCVDCDCPSQFVYVAAMQGAIAAQNALDETPSRKMDYRVVPHAIFTVPEVAGVGLKEEEARKQGYPVKTSLLDFHWVPRAEVMLDERGLIKMVAEADTLRILGVHMVAHNAGDLIHEAVLAVKYKLTAQDLVDTLHVYPTLSEAIRICAQGFFKDVTKLSCCAE